MNINFLIYTKDYYEDEGVSISKVLGIQNEYVSANYNLLAVGYVLVPYSVLSWSMLYSKNTMFWPVSFVPQCLKRRFGEIRHQFEYVKFFTEHFLKNTSCFCKNEK